MENDWEEEYAEVDRLLREVTQLNFRSTASSLGKVRFEGRVCLSGTRERDTRE